MKNSSLSLEIEKLKLVYNDIVNGYSFSEERSIYVKHFSESSYAKVLAKKFLLIALYRKEGLPAEEDREKEIIEQELWTPEKNDRITQLRYLISDNEKYAQGMMIPQQKSTVLTLVKKDKNELVSLLAEKDGVLGPTCERFAEKELENYFLDELFCKDQDLKIKYFNPGELDEMDYEELMVYKVILNTSLGKVNEEDMNKIGCLPFFLNSLSLVKDRPENFLGKPINLLTHNQHNLLSIGLKNINVHSQSEGSPPSLVDDTIEDLMRWYDQQYSILLGKSGKGSGAVTSSVREV